MTRLVLVLLMCLASAMAVLVPAGSSHAQAALNVNTATVAELDSLPGIGPSKAAAIVAARTRRPFRRLSDLLRVPGIGRATLERLAPLVRFDDPPSSE